MNVRRGSESTLLLTFIGFLWGCGQPPEGWTPVMEETSIAFLVTETERAMEHVREAIEHLDESPDRLASDLEEAESSLEHVLDYYLPLFRARERAYNAYRLNYLGDQAGVDRELAGVEEILTDMAQQAEGQRLLEIESLAETLADARMTAAAENAQERATLEILARRLNQAALKGDLILKR